MRLTDLLHPAAVLAAPEPDFEVFELRLARMIGADRVVAPAAPVFRAAGAADPASPGRGIARGRIFRPRLFRMRLSRSATATP